jgi:hypothetical protein
LKSLNKSFKKQLWGMGIMASKRSSNNQGNSKELRQNIEAKAEKVSLTSDQETDLDELADLEAELGMEEVALDQDVIDTVAVDDSDDNLDADNDGVYDESEDEAIIDNRPQSLTQSYGTGLQGKPSDRAGRFSRRDTHMLNEPDYTLTGGDVDANPEDADAVGEEAVGGTVGTPDQDVIEDLAAAVGIQTDDRSYLRTSDMLEQRDNRRWELDPQSAEDYEQHQE